MISFLNGDSLLLSQFQNETQQHKGKMDYKDPRTGSVFLKCYQRLSESLNVRSLHKQYLYNENFYDYHGDKIVREVS